MHNTSISFKKVRFGYPESTNIFQDLNFEIKKNEYVGFNGNNGSGKSTIFKLIIGSIKPNSGTIETDYNKIAYLPQNSNFDRNFPINIADMLKMARFANKNANIQSINLVNALEKVKLEKPLNCPLNALSGGQFQRVVFARMLLIEPDLLILDEPFNGIDEKTMEDMAELLKEINAKNTTILLAVHDNNFLKNHVPKVMELKNGKLAPLEFIK